MELAEDADLLVFVDNSGAAAIGDARWYYVSSIFQCTAKLFWAGPEDAGAVKVFFVDAAEKAGWRVEGHPMRGQF